MIKSYLQIISINLLIILKEILFIYKIKKVILPGKIFIEIIFILLFFHNDNKLFFFLVIQN